MMVVKGVNVFPSQIETVLLNDGYEANYQLVVDRVNNSDTIACDVEWNSDNPPKDSIEREAKEKKLVAHLKSMLGIVVDVNLVAPKSIPRSEGKAVRVEDNRKLYEENTLK